MTIAKSLVPGLAAASDTVTITLVVSNTGTSEAFEVIVDDPLPDAKFIGMAAATTPAGFAFSTVAAAPNTIVRYTGGSIPAGENRTFVFTAQLTSGVVKGEVLTNVATVTQATTLPAQTRANGMSRTCRPTRPSPSARRTSQSSRTTPLPV